LSQAAPNWSGCYHALNYQNSVEEKPMKPPDDLGFVHVFVPAERPTPESVTHILLHGTGGDEQDLLPLGRELWPGAGLLGVRGNVLENGMPRFFRRFAEGVFDVDDLKARTNELAQFIDRAAQHYGFSKQNLVAVGYSNGANVAASLILLHPHYLKAAVLFRAMVPFTPDLIRNFSSLSVFIAASERDPIVPRDQTEQLAAVLESGGANVALFWHQGGHELGADDVMAAKRWLQEIAPTTRAA
jgi:predicted esterase